MVPTDQLSALQKHVLFFDKNHDGIIYPWETYRGFRAVGAGRLLSLFFSVSINVGLSRTTRPGKFFSPVFPIVVKNIHMAKHGSDSGVYDDSGRFVPSKFEEIFTKYARTHREALTSDELKEMVNANRQPEDFKGRIASLMEWKLLHHLFKDKNGLLQRETIRAMFDGSLFERTEKERKKRVIDTV